MIILKEIKQEVKGEDLTVQINGSNVLFTTSNDYKSGTLVVNLSGLEQRKGYDYDEISSTQFQFTKAPKIGMTLLVEYIKQ